MVGKGYVVDREYTSASDKRINIWGTENEVYYFRTSLADGGGSIFYTMSID